ncbi:hypothetical protein HMPREF1868_01241 [Olsenella sp. DNF00959]|nr:hypothetical protein HMPREF1868_01241 [Olsenella sp. DNF00959]
MAWGRSCSRCRGRCPCLPFTPVRVTLAEKVQQTQTLSAYGKKSLFVYKDNAREKTTERRRTWTQRVRRRRSLWEAR